MNAVSPITPAAPTEAADIVALFEATPSIVLLDKEKGAAFFAAVKAEVDAYPHDMSTTKGREATRALAAKVTTTKTTIDKARLALTEGWRKETARVNAAGKEAEAMYAALAAEARKPLTEWEAAEAAKRAKIQGTFDRLQAAPVVQLGDTSTTLAARLSDIRAVEFDADFEAEHRQACERLRSTAIDALTTAIARAEQAERDAADLQRLRDAEAARQAAAPPPEIEAVPHPALAASPMVASEPAPVPVSAPVRSASEEETLAVLGRVKLGLMDACGLDEPTARRVALAVARNQVPHLTINLETRHAG